ncbi:hypothetical protein HDG38_000505 [Paraburkholderia sp. WSM4177]|nr:hypothetical protein [Paraburkholderia sp. WSM4177]MBB5482312.1 hypothetical protein [Paraburkholderia sp. WSM4180]
MQAMEGGRQPRKATGRMASVKTCPASTVRDRSNADDGSSVQIGPLPDPWMWIDVD